MTGQTGKDPRAKLPDGAVAQTTPADFGHTTTTQAEILNMTFAALGDIHRANKAQAAAGAYRYLADMQIDFNEIEDKKA
jgi:hypothetical protein